MGFCAGGKGEFNGNQDFETTYSILVGQGDGNLRVNYFVVDNLALHPLNVLGDTLVENV